MRWGSWALVISSFPPRLRSEDWGEIELSNYQTERAGLDVRPSDPEGWGDMLANILMVHLDAMADEDYDTKGLMEAFTAIFVEWRTNPSMTPSEAAYSLAAKGKG
tara:strand:+ start:611 stop:925 length:315 start_codon:yes stop_codon:yes gene_type:complete